MEELAAQHLVREEDLLGQANRFLFTDTNAITTYMFSLAYHDMATPGLEELADQAASRYDLMFVCDTDIPHEDTWDRSGDVNRQTFQKDVLTDLASRKVPFVVLHGDLESRVQQVKAILDKFEKYAGK